MKNDLLNLFKILLTASLGGAMAWAAPIAMAQSPASAPEASEATAKAAEASDPPLTQQRFYEILLADIASQRHEPVLAARTYLQLAQDMQSLWFAQRATESALTARDHTLLNRALEMWQELDPTSDRPQRIKTQVARIWQQPLSQVGDESEVRARLEELLKEAAANGSLDETFLQLNAFFAKKPDKVAVFNTIRELALPYLQLPEAHYAVALAALVVTTDKAAERALPKILQEGMREIDLALKGAPQWDEAVQLKAALLEKAAPEQLLPWLQSSVQKAPAQKNLWPLLARAYAQQKQYPEAREWFLKIWKDNSSDAALMAAGALSIQMEDRVAAQELLDEVEKKESGDKVNALRLVYARIAEDEKRPLEAIEWYRKIDGGDDFPEVRLHLATLLAQNGKRDEALALLAELPAVTQDERIGVLLARTRILRNAGDTEKAFKELEKGVEAFPESVDLLMELGLVEEKRGNLKSAEKYLRAALKLKPNEPYVQNALGYTLVDHQLNVEEGAALIEKAHQAMPDDGAILDSMGWARYRQGKIEEAARYLQQAWEKQPDPEVAAHWGEALWQLGRREEARRAWAQGVKKALDDTLIRATMKRLGAGEPDLLPAAP
ncbi:MAG: tetratricopeptide repeat protein [Proteobacteria bacterium]|nr:tetratricopeptide repeat protein [Pseudomonadota bacterium]MCL2309513.1 tetratricopeptide repeat protein [Pseudomonadota bacterium]